MKKIYISVFGFLLIINAFGQTDEVKGKVSDAGNNNPLAGAMIQVSGKGRTITDKDGMFSVACSDSMEITVQYLGYETYKQRVRNCKEDLNIALHSSRYNLNEVEIIVTPHPDTSFLYQPLSNVKLGVTELKRGTGLFLDDAINTNVPGVFMERRTVSAGQQFNIRGYGNGARGTNGVNSNFDGQGSKIYLNNIPLTDAEGITLMDDIDFGSVENVEVIKGPAGTLYGLAIAGVVNLQTKKAEKGKTSIGQDVLMGDYGLQRYTTRFQTAGARSSLLISYGNQKSNGFMAHTASHKDFVNITGEFQPNTKQTINTYIAYSKSYDERGGELDTVQYKNFDYSGNPVYIKNNAHSEIISFRAGVGHTYHFNKYISNTTSVFGSGVTNSGSSAAGWTDKRPVNYGTRSTLNIKYPLNEKFNLSGITGVEAQRQDAQTIGYGMVADSTNLSGYNIIGPMRSNQATVSQTSSVFTEWTLTMPWEISFTAGAGLSTMHIELQDRFYVPANNRPVNGKPTTYKASYNNMISPHFAINKVISKQLSVYASYSKGYKAPVSSYFFIPLTGALNTGLKPEIGNQFEIGTKGSLFKNKLIYQIAVFDAIFSNKMTTVAVPNAANTATSFTYVANGGSQDNKGLEVLLKYNAYQSAKGFFRSIKPFANFCYSNFKYKNFRFQQLNAAKNDLVTADYSGNKVAGVPPVTFNAGVDIATVLGFYGNVNYSYRDAMPFTSDGKNRTSSYGLLNAKLGIRQNLFRHFDLDVYIGANNITGKQYYYMVFLNQLPDTYMPAPFKINYFGGLNLKYNL